MQEPDAVRRTLEVVPSSCRATCRTRSSSKARRRCTCSRCCRPEEARGSSPPAGARPSTTAFLRWRRPTSSASGAQTSRFGIDIVGPPLLPASAAGAGAKEAGEANRLNRPGRRAQRSRARATAVAGRAGDGIGHRDQERNRAEREPRVRHPENEPLSESASSRMPNSTTLASASADSSPRAVANVSVLERLIAAPPGRAH